MNELPDHSNLNIHLLSRCFRNVSNSYKYYWFLSILDHLLENESPYISYDEISLRMLSSVWYPLDFYKLSFGLQDGFKELASAVSTYIKIDNGPKAKSLFHQIENDLPVEASRKLRNTIKTVLKRWVTFRFLSPFFEDNLKGLPDQKVNDKILQLTNLDANANFAPYKILADGILLNSEWTDYFMSNQVVLRGFIKWHLLTFLQKNNPNVIGLSQKLEKPIMRDLKLAKAFWSSFLKHNVANCIYSEIVIPKTGFSLDHFIPWTYVAHDLVWNIIPTTISINSAKSNSLPSLTRYLDAFCDFQYLALKFHVKEGHNKLMEDYFTLFRQANFESLDKIQFCTILKFEISNNYRTAENMGFKSSYIY